MSGLIHRLHRISQIKLTTGMNSSVLWKSAKSVDAFFAFIVFVSFASFVVPLLSNEQKETPNRPKDPRRLSPSGGQPTNGTTTDNPGRPAAGTKSNLFRVFRGYRPSRDSEEVTTKHPARPSAATKKAKKSSFGRATRKFQRRHFFALDVF